MKGKGWGKRSRKERIEYRRKDDRKRGEERKGRKNGKRIGMEHLFGKGKKEERRKEERGDREFRLEVR